jgi:hypothetical protein
MPGQFLVNQADVSDNAREYAWEVSLDADNDGQSDLDVTVMRFKPPGSSPQLFDDVLTFTQKNLWRALPGGTLTSIQAIPVSLDGNVFTFTVDANADAALSSVQSADQCTWKTFFRFGSQPQDTCRDEWRPGSQN